MTANVVAPLGGADLEKLTREMNLLDRMRDDHMQQLGIKLIQVRQVLQQMNGKWGKAGLDGLSPKGWYPWCDAAGIARPTAYSALSRAVNPENHRLKTSRANAVQSKSAKRCISVLHKGWLHWTYDERQKVVDAVKQLVTEANRAAA